MRGTVLTILAGMAALLTLAAAPAQETTPPEPATPTAYPTQTPWVIIIREPTPTPEQHPPQSLSDPRLHAGDAALSSNAPQAARTRLGRIDALIDGLWPIWVQQQLAYREMTGGRYFQGLLTHSRTPAGDDYPDRWLDHPTDQQYRWADFGGLRLSPMSFAVRMDTYTGPEGPGWVACIRAVDRGQTWQCCINYGPEVSRNTDWEVVSEP